MQPRVSICCSVLNQTEFLRGMIENVREQVFKDWELVLVDDGSTEDIGALVQSFNDERIRLHRFAENKGVPHGMNWALENARGEYVQPLSTDERLEPNKLLWQVGFLDDNPRVDALWGLPFNGELGQRPEWEQNHLKAHNRSNAAWIRTLLNLECIPIGGASMLMRRSVLEDIGLFDPQFYTTSDLEWYCRFFAHGHKGLVMPYRWAWSVDNPKALSLNVTREAFQKDLANVRAKHPMPRPKVMSEVTVAIPVRNMAQTIAATLNSVLAQTWEHFRIVVLDDASTDNTVDIVRSFHDHRISLIQSLDHIGVNAAQNQMLARCETPFFAILAADDTVAPTWLERMIGEFVADPWLEFVAPQTDFIGTDGLPHEGPHAMKNVPQAKNRSQDEWKQVFRGGNVYFGAGMYRTEAAKEIGGWMEEAGVISDYAMYLALVHRYNLRIIEEPLVHTRIHDGNRSILRTHQSFVDLKRAYKLVKDKYYQPMPKLIIATAFYELRGFSPYIVSLVETAKLLTQVGIEWQFWQLSGDSYVERAKNTIMTKFLEEADATHLLMVDSDMEWDPMAVLKLLQLPDPLIVGSYPQKNAWGRWTSIPESRMGEDGKEHPVGRMIEGGRALLKAAYLAGGFMMIKRPVLEMFRDKYPELRYRDPSADPHAPEREYISFSECVTKDGLRWGEDRVFGQRLDAIGIAPMIYPDINFGHYGVKGWTGNFHEMMSGRGKQQDPGNERVH